LIITGTGRCGTGFMAEVLTRAGRPCTHEERFGPLGWVDMAAGEAEASWMALPFLEQQSTTVIGVWRDAEPVISSLLGTKMFTRPGRAYGDFARRHAELPADPLNAAAEFWCQWNQRLIEAADIVTPITAPDWDAIATVAGVPAQKLRDAAEDVGAGVNTRQRSPFNWEAVRCREFITETTRALEGAR